MLILLVWRNYTYKSIILKQFIHKLHLFFQKTTA